MAQRLTAGQGPAPSRSTHSPDRSLAAVGGRKATCCPLPRKALLDGHATYELVERAHKARTLALNAWHPTIPRYGNTNGATKPQSDGLKPSQLTQNVEYEGQIKVTNNGKLELPLTVAGWRW